MTKITREQNAIVLWLGGRYPSLDDKVMEEFGRILLAEAAQAEPPRLVLDFSATDFIGSTFIELLVRAWKRLRERQGGLALCEMGPFCLEIFKTSCLDTVLPIYPTREEALAAIALPDWP